jgi:hypothetical protein
MADSARAHLIFSFRKVLRPLIKILIRAGVTYDEFRMWRPPCARASASPVR